MKNIEPEGCLSVEPQNFQEMLRSNEKEKWVNAMKEQISSLMKNDTWNLSDGDTEMQDLSKEKDLDVHYNEDVEMKNVECECCWILESTDTYVS